MNACSTQYRRRFSSLRANDRCTHSFPRKRFLCGGGVGGLLTSSLPLYIPYPPSLPSPNLAWEGRGDAGSAIKPLDLPILFLRDSTNFTLSILKRPGKKGFFLLQFLQIILACMECWRKSNHSRKHPGMEKKQAGGRP